MDLLGRHAQYPRFALKLLEYNIKTGTFAGGTGGSKWEDFAQRRE